MWCCYGSRIKYYLKHKFGNMIKKILIRMHGIFVPS